MLGIKKKLSKSKFLTCITKVNPSNENETKSDVSPYLNLAPYLFYQKILKYFNAFQNRSFSAL